jgi:membrane protein implicated in regulation of membrane protease activity
MTTDLPLDVFHLTWVEILFVVVMVIVIAAFFARLSERLSRPSKKGRRQSD